MSEYVYIATAPGFKSGNQQLYKIGVANSLGAAINSLQNASPLRLQLVHSFLANNRAKAAQSGIYAKFKNKHSHHGWFALNQDEVSFIRSLNASNFNDIIPEELKRLIRVREEIEERTETKRKEARVKKTSTKTKTRASKEDLEALRQQLLAEAESAATAYKSVKKGKANERTKRS